MGSAAPLIGACAAAVAAVAVLRIGWSRPRRSVALNGVGWGLMAVAAVLAGWHSGAWGISVATLAGMGAALLLLADAALGSQATAGGRASNRRAGMLPEGNQPLGLGRRILTFVIVSLLAMTVSVGVAIPFRTIALLCGAAEADANVLVLMAMPIAWAILAYVLLMKPRRAAQLRVLLAWAAVAALGISAEMIR